MIAELDKLIELQKTDTNLRRLKNLLETANTRRAEIEQEFEQHAFSVREIQNRRDELHTKRADLEKQIAENKTYLERADRNLKHAQNSKEYETAMRETDALQKQIAAFETQIVETMEGIEEVEKEIEERADEINTLDAKRADPTIDDIPVIVLSTSSDSRDITGSYLAGASSYVRKPVDMEGFSAAMRLLKEWWFDAVILPPESA